MRRTFGVLAAGALLVASCTSTQPLEDKISKVEGQTKSLEGKVTAVESKAAAAEAKAAAAEGQAKSLEGKVGKVALPGGERIYPVMALEIKGSTTATKLAPPNVDPAKLSDGYGFKKPGDADTSDATKWEVSSYAFSPGFMVATQGDKVTLRIFVVNGDKHETMVLGPDGKTEVVKKQTLNRGREYKLTFTADQAGLYALHCDTHDPTMHSTILVLPRQ